VIRKGYWALKFDRCPKSWLRDEADREKMMFDDSMRYIEHGTLPRVGGFEDQHPRFCASVPIVSDVLMTLRAPVHGNS
jgi:hypothetical protein